METQKTERTCYITKWEGDDEDVVISFYNTPNNERRVKTFSIDDPTFIKEVVVWIRKGILPGA